MGMYDTIVRFEPPLPGNEGKRSSYQTKSLNCWLNQFEVNEQGRLVRVGELVQYTRDDPVDEGFTGEVCFYDYDPYCVEYDAEFRDGVLVKCSLAVLGRHPFRYWGTMPTIEYSFEDFELERKAEHYDMTHIPEVLFDEGNLAIYGGDGCRFDRERLVFGAKGTEEDAPFTFSFYEEPPKVGETITAVTFCLSWDQIPAVVEYMKRCLERRAVMAGGVVQVSKPLVEKDQLSVDTVGGKCLLTVTSAVAGTTATVALGLGEVTALRKCLEVLEKDGSVGFPGGEHGESQET